MTRVSSFDRAVAWLAFVLLVGVPSLAPAQGTMTFGEDEAKDIENEDGSDSKDDGPDSSSSSSEEGMTFEAESSSESSDSQSETPLVGLVAVPSEAMSSSQRQQLKETLVSAMQPVQKVKLASGTAVLDELQKRTVASCVTEPLCLGSVGGDAGVDRILMARVERNQDSFQLDIDYFNVSERLFIKYKSLQGLGTFGDVIDAVQPAIEEIFGLDRPTDTSTPGGRASSSKALTIVGITSAGLSAGALTAGILFGLKANDLESQLEGERNGEGTYGITQTRAQEMFDNAQNKAGLSTGFYITSGVLAAAGGVFLVLGSNGSGAEQPPPSRARSNPSSPSWSVTPTAGSDSVGIRARFSF